MGRPEGLRAEIEILRRRWRTIVGVVFASILVFALIHERAAKSYTATASVAFQNSTLLDSALNIATATSSEPQREADTEVLIAHSPEVAEAVREQLKTTASASELLGEVKVEAAPTADVLNVVATTHEPKTSATLANAFATQYIAFREKAQLVGIASDESKIRAQIAGLSATSPERVTLEQTLLRLGSLQAVASGGTSVIGRATPPGSPNGGGLSEAIVIGFLIGAAIALSVVFLLESLDRRVRTLAEFERGYRLPALVGIPQTSSRTLQDESSPLLEPYRILRSALGFTAVTRPLNTLLVTSAVAGEGKTTVAANLAYVLALSGRRTVLVELDLRRPTSFGPIELRASRGVTSAITGAGELGSLLVKPLPALPSLLVLPSGALPHNPSELLGSERVADLLAELTADGSMVIIDTPPLNPVADVQVLLDNPAIDAAVIVARVDRTTREQMRHARSVLDHHRVEPIGIVVTGVRDPDRYGYDYGAYQAAPAEIEVEDTRAAARHGQPKIVEDEAEIDALATPANGSASPPANGSASAPASGSAPKQASD
ncbi:MAG TPA: polysaccharide biosynthesis tyrosine autokinase [Solirubrobacteraceae bacterium]|nr:polysaccharide biosynthesis tyrosine autokinase [Solirubrobacteraceae bacterium]